MKAERDDPRPEAPADIFNLFPLHCRLYHIQCVHIPKTKKTKKNKKKTMMIHGARGHFQFVPSVQCCTVHHGTFGFCPWPLHWLVFKGGQFGGRCSGAQIGAVILTLLHR